MRRRASLLLVLLVACGDGTGPGDGPDVAGTYTLARVGTDTVPVLVDEGEEGGFYVDGGELDLAADGTYADTLRVRIESVQYGTTVQERDDYGTYTVLETGQGVRIILTSGKLTENGQPLDRSAAYSDGRITLANGRAYPVTVLELTYEHP